MSASTIIGKFATFNSVLKPEITLHHSIYGEIVEMYHDDIKRDVEFCRGQPKIKMCTVLLIRLGTFAKDQLIEMPAEYVTVHDTLVDAKDYTNVH